jgi:hypothetical protein
VSSRAAAAAPYVGVSNTRLSKILRGLSALTVTELVTLCELLDLDPARVLRTAQASLEDIHPYPVAHAGTEQPDDPEDI